MESCGMSKGLRLGVLLCFAFVVLSVLAAPAAGFPPKHAGHGGEDPVGPSTFAPVALGHTPCRNGFADVYPCHGIDLESFMPLSDLGADPGERAAGIWGWTDPETRREYALIALRNRVSFVDITDSRNPRFVGYLPGVATGTPNREVNVYGHLALVVADGGGSNGIQFFDLTQLRGATGAPVRFTNSAGIVSESGRIHNIAVNPDSGFAYAVGGRCGGGLNMIDLRSGPPQDVGCWADPAHSYIHDTQCVIYRGPDGRFRGREICFASAENALLIVDVTDKSAPRKISRTSYPGVGYSHQAWLTEDHKHLLMNDEGDESQAGQNTRTYLWSVSDLTAPRQFAAYEHPTRSTDHNLYVRGKQVYESNYTAGLRILDISRIAAGELREVGFFDIVPDMDEPRFDGAWGNHPFFPSGNIAVSGINQGLYILRQSKQTAAGGCKAGPEHVCLQSRLSVEIGWRNPSTGETGAAKVLKRGPNFGVFSLGSGQADLIVRTSKAGQSLQFLYGQLTNLQFSIGATDVRTKRTQRFYNGSNNCGGVGRISKALLADEEWTAPGEDDLFGLLNPHVLDFVKPGDGLPDDLDLSSTAKHEGGTGTCKTGPNRLCLHAKRFQVELTYRDSARGASGTAKATRISDDSGTFAFKPANGVDVAVKTSESGETTRIVWGSLTSAEYTLSVTDTLTGRTKTYTNPAGTFCGGVDEAGF